MSEPEGTFYYLDCSYEEKDLVKALGARFDGSSRRWFVPSNRYADMARFNQWRPSGRVYLDCPYSQKDQVKRAGAKWDPTVKSWYTPLAKGANVPFKFSSWIKEEYHYSHSSPKGKVQEKASTKDLKPSPAREAVVKKTTTKKRGNAQDAATLRISDSMTMSQLQDECRLRGIKGISGKNKDYLLDQLGIGFVWQIMSMSHNSTTRKSPAPAAAAAAAAAATKKKSTTDQTKKATTVAPPSKKVPSVKKAPIMKPSPKAASSGNKTKAKAKGPSGANTDTTNNIKSINYQKAIDWHSLPRVSSNLTVAQLTHELLHRQPWLKGASKKSKSWFLERLGENSVWSTSPDCQQAGISNQSVVSSSLTTAQLTHEIMSRRSLAGSGASSVNQGLSNKNKTELLTLVGEGSLWTTAPPPQTTKKSTATKKAKTKKAPASDEPAQEEDQTRAVLLEKESTIKAKTKSVNRKKKKPKNDLQVMVSSASGVVAAAKPARAKSIKPSAVSSSTNSVLGNKRHQKVTTEMAKKKSKLEHGSTFIAPMATSSMTVGLMEEAMTWQHQMSNPRDCWPPFNNFENQEDVISFKPDPNSDTSHTDDEDDDGNDSDDSNDSDDDSVRKKFPSKIRKLPSANKNETCKLKYTVWTKDVHRKQDESDVEIEFNSSFATLEEANLRVEYVFYHDNPWGIDQYGMYADDDSHLKGDFRYLRNNPDYGGCLVVSVIPTEAFDVLSGYTEYSDVHYHALSGRYSPPSEPPKECNYAEIIRCPWAASKNQSAKLQFTVWTSCGYDYDGWHSYQGAPEKEFNSSYATLEQANKRAEYVFYYENPWGLTDEYDLPYPETDKVTRKGLRYLQCRPDDSERWTVSVIPSSAFDFINL